MLLTGAILAPGTRTVARLLRITGLAQERHFVNYHRVLNWAVWSPCAAAGCLLRLLSASCAPRGPVVLGLDDTIERCRGKRIAAKGIYRDPIRSSNGHFVKASGLRWLSLMLLAPTPWAGRVWALPFLTALAPSERYNHSHRRPHKKLTDWGRQLVLQSQRWRPSTRGRLPGRPLVLVTDSSFAVLGFLAALSRHNVTCITRLPGTNGRPRTNGKCLTRLSEVLEDPATAWQSVTMPGWYGGGKCDIEISTSTAVWRHGGMPVVPLPWVLIRDPLGQLDPQALLCINPAQDPVQVLRWFVQRWQVEATFREVRDHLGVETQRQWSDKAIARTTPCLLGLFSLGALLGKKLTPHASRATAASAWYCKQRPTFSYTFAAVRREIWREQGFVTSSRATDMKKLRPALRNGIAYALCHAA